MLTERYNSFEGIITPEQLDKLKRGRILLAGCGAGSNISPLLVREGIATSKEGIIIIADPGLVELRNLDRQFYFERDLGENKAKALDKNLKLINSDLNTRVIEEGVTEENVKDLVENTNLVVEMVDISRPTITYSVHQECQKQRKPLITGLDLADNTLSYVFNYSNPDSMTLQQFLGLAKDTAAADFANLNDLAIVAQMIIGPVNHQLNNLEEMNSYYSELFFQNEENMIGLRNSLPEEMLPIVGKLLSGEIDHVPQTDIAGALLGASHAKIVKEIILGYPVKEAPEPITINLSSVVKK